MVRKGIASLLALVVLAVASAVVAGMLASARNAALVGMVAERQLATDTLLADGERFACAWLDKHGGQVVLPPSGGALLLTDHHWQDSAGRNCRLAIAVHDACAVLPPSALAPGHPLRFAMPSPGSGPVLPTSTDVPPPAEVFARVRLPTGWSRLPEHIPSTRPVGSSVEWLAMAPQPTLIGWVAPDNPGAINANTAPASILRIAGGDLLDAESVLTSRRAGERWSGPACDGAHGVQIVAASSRWYVILSARIGSHQATRMAVGDGANGRMRIIRRYDATPASPPAVDP